MSSQPFKIHSLIELKQWIESHRDLFKAGSLILLNGGLGAGKTTFVSLVVEVLGGEGSEVSSPTFSLHQTYKAQKLNVDHMDLYRLESDQELHSSGFFEVLEERDHLRFIEWADRLPAQVYEGFGDVFKIQLKVINDNEREISFKRL
jgi:tRNA threonylcarbamoyladenosine biosynthesis protein TsaE